MVEDLPLQRPGMPRKPLRLVGLGCGGRTLTYCSLAARHPDRYVVVAGADPIELRVDALRRASGNPEFRSFRDDHELFAAGLLGDVCVIGTQDAYHVEPAMRAMELGYDLLLEKPIAPSPAEIVALLAAARRLGRKVLVCHVLRYAPINERIQGLLKAGAVGEVVSIDAREGVEPWHQCHSYVRGHWSVTGKCTPMLIAKSCHDLDLISWFAGSPCERVSSHGRLHHFRQENAPPGAPSRCTDGCPAGDRCPYNALRYVGDRRHWLYVMDGHQTATDEQITDWLRTSPWGRCVYRCDNDAVDRQVVAMQFAGGVTATFTMTAFDSGRSATICGTRGVLRAGEVVRRLCGRDIVVEPFEGKPEFYDALEQAGGYDGHGGGDVGLVGAMDREFARPAGEMRSGLEVSVESNLIGYAAEQARRAGTVVDMAAYRRGLMAALP